MLPYFHFLYFQIGPVKIYTWGFFVSLGFLAAYFYLAAKDPEHKIIFLDTLIYVLIGGIIGARLAYCLFYSPNAMATLKDFYKIWNGGMSSFGGFAGGAAAAWLYARRKKINLYWLLNRVAFVLPLGLAVARLGCYLINDHPGIKTTASFLSVAYPDGPRYDLGFLEMIFSALIFIYFLSRRRPFDALVGFLLIYGSGRFVMDFLRIGEPRYYGLIPSQYGSIIILAIGLYLIKNHKKYYAKLA